MISAEKSTHSLGNLAIKLRLKVMLDQTVSLAEIPTAVAGKVLTYRRTEADRMKPFITAETSAAGQKVLRLQCENIESENIPKYVQDLSVVAYSMPAGHSFQAAWIFRLIFSNGSSLEFSSACTMVVGWQEVGSLNIQLINQAKPDIDAVLVRVEVPPFRVTSLVKLVYGDNNVRSECGIAMGGENEEEIVVATGISPGAVSIAAPFSTSAFEPEFSVSECNREFM